MEYGFWADAPFDDAAEVELTVRQRSRRRAIRWTSAFVGLLFLSIVLLAPAIGGLVTQ